MSAEDPEARALRESEERFRALSDAAREAVLIQENGVVREVNQAFTALLGYSRDEIVGQSGTKFISPESWPIVQAAIRAAERGGAGGTSEITLLTKSGERRLVESCSAPLSYQGRPMRVVTMQDLTARRAVEAALHESDERLRAAMTAARMGDWHFDIEKDELTWSPQIYDIFGVEPGTFGGTLEAFIAHVHPDDRKRVRETIAERVSGAGTDFATEHRILWPDGSTHWVENRGRAFRDADGRAIRMTGTSMDTTRRHELEEQLLHSQRMEATGRLAGGIAHDFNNLLTVIMSYSELGRFALNSAHPSFEALEQINVAAQRAAALTRQLLIFARKEVVDPKVIDVNHLVENVAKLLRRVVGEDVLVALDIADEPAPVTMDPVQCEQLLMNLAVNARDAMPGGGSLRIRSEQTPDAVLISVSDSGLGMPKEVQARAFEPFFTTKDAGKGTGLGLSTCLAIVRRAGGTIRVDSEPGIGTTFHIELPRARGGAEAESPERPSIMPRGDETVLLIEDDAIVRQLTARILRQQGYSVLVATQADEALQLAADHATRIDLFLSDVVMPGASGPSVIEQLSAGRPRAKVLFVSGYPGDDVSRHGVNQTSFPFLAKPYSSEQLAQRVRQVLDG
ncbi:MAG TPA: PAS domain-containing protein [Polyangiaceae bacterium]|jgi:two-component system cell cycle sensor histidine kinase/response regulator CckA|nr:PAS domain-containing protein [Polyangiaceae bacterium]